MRMPCVWRSSWRRACASEDSRFSAGIEAGPIRAYSTHEPGPATGGRPMTREQIFALFARREASWRARDAPALASDHAPDGVVVSPTGGVLEGRAEIERIYRVWFVAFPDLNFTTEDLLVDNDRAALLCR